MPLNTISPSICLSAPCGGGRLLVISSFIIFLMIFISFLLTLAKKNVFVHFLFSSVLISKCFTPCASPVFVNDLPPGFPVSASLFVVAVSTCGSSFEMCHF